MLVGLLALSWVGFLIASAYLETQYQLAAHRNHKALEAQRVLADKAEASRFTELRTYLENQAATSANREAATTTRLEHAVQGELRGLLAAMDRLSAKLTPYSTEITQPGVLQRTASTPH